MFQRNQSSTVKFVCCELVFQTEPFYLRRTLCVCENSETLVKNWSWLKEVGGWRDMVSESLVGGDRLGARCLWSCRNTAGWSIQRAARRGTMFGTVLLR